MIELGIGTREYEIELIVSKLDGYLQAVADMNDDHSGARYSFGADLIRYENEQIPKVIAQYINALGVTTKPPEISEIDLERELKIINSYILDNYMQGSSIPGDTRQEYIKNLHGWRIQEYVALAADYERINGRWMVEITKGRELLTFIFAKIEQQLVVLNFMKETKSPILKIV